MHNIYFPKEDGYTTPFESGYIILTDRGGHHHKNLALNVPEYGWVPCSRKLEHDFSDKPEDLVLVVFDPDDSDIPYTSDVWVSKTHVQTETITLW